MTFIVFILILSVLVLIHEFGHYIVAKLNGIRVEEFGWGLPPRVVGKKLGETIYSINILPFGGFVRLTGEDGDAKQQGDASSDVTPLDPRSFAVKKPWQRALVLVAGVVMNFFLAFLIFYIYFLINNFKTAKLPLFFDHTFRFGREIKYDTMVLDLVPDFPATKSGIELGDTIVSIDGTNVTNIEEIRKSLLGKSNQEVSVLVESEVKGSRTIKLTPKNNEEGNPSLGVYVGEAVVIDYGTNLLSKLLSAPMHSYNVLAYSMNGLKQVFAFSYETKSIEPVSRSVSGPVGMFKIVDNILNEGGKNSLLHLMDFAGLMSLSLAFMNILPFPALDGGRLFFVLLEGFTGKKIPVRIESFIHGVGMAVLLTLILLITVKDLFIK
jgi:regulator of sigma E protease